ncbi:MAG: alpha/beta hydrolase [Deltaproteobacteria bacterium]|nr:alpha/beta hydrolase [Deltaproteobacteria bacterium]
MMQTVISKIKTLTLFLWAALFFLPRFLGAESHPALDNYSYPIKNPYLATVVGTPVEDQAQLPEKIRLKVFNVQRFPDRTVPPIFWGGQSLHYTVARQKGPAPLVFIIAGTGGNHFDSKVIFLMRALYQAGFHTVGISSPTHPSFITTASASEMPGLPNQDAQDLTAVMQLIRRDLEKKIEITSFGLMGYSLGATQAAFVAEIDSRQKDFDFQHIYLINPAVNLYTSAGILDELYLSALPQGDQSINNLVSSSLRDAVHYVHASGRSPLGSDFLYRAIEQMHPSDVDLEGAIATVFRLSSSNLSFTADLMTGSGKIVEPGTQFKTGTNMDPYFNSSLQWSFLRYFDELLLPFWKARLDLSRKELVSRAGLAHIQKFLKQSSNIQVVTNADDLILGPGDIDFLEKTFGDRATIYPWGGHCGNLEFKENIKKMQDAFLASKAGEAS